MPVLETWGEGNGSDWTIAEGADNDWLNVGIRFGGDLSIVSGLGRANGMSNFISASVAVVGPSESDLDILFRATHNDGLSVAAVVRFADEDNFYILGFDSNNSVALAQGVLSGVGLHVSKVVGGTVSLIAEDLTTSVAEDGDTWFRAQVEGTALRLKAWADGDPEPGSWDIETTDSEFASGLAGVGLGGVDSTQIDFHEWESTDPAGGGGATTVEAAPADLMLAAQGLSPSLDPLAVPVAPAALQLTAQALQVATSPVTVELAPASLGMAASSLSPVLAPQSVDLAPAELDLQAQTLAPQAAGAPVSVTLAPALLTISPQPVQPTPAPTTVVLVPAGMTLEAIAVSPQQAPFVVVLVPAEFALTAELLQVVGGGPWWTPDKVGYAKSRPGLTPAKVGYTPK